MTRAEAADISTQLEPAIASLQTALNAAIALNGDENATALILLALQDAQEAKQILQEAVNRAVCM